MPANDCKTISLFFFCLIQQQKPAPIWEGLSASLHQSLQWCQCKDSALPVLIPAVLWSTSRQLCPPKPARTMQEKMIKQREMGVRASPLPPQGYWALPRSASGWHSWIWAASLKHTLFLLCFSQSSQRDRILLRKMGISTQHTVNYLPTQQLLYWQMFQGSVLHT